MESIDTQHATASAVTNVRVPSTREIGTLKMIGRSKLAASKVQGAFGGSMMSAGCFIAKVGMKIHDRGAKHVASASLRAEEALDLLDQASEMSKARREAIRYGQQVVRARYADLMQS